MLGFAPIASKPVGAQTGTTAAAGSTVTGVNVSPTTATGSQTFTATVAGTGSPSQAVTWSTTAGSINSSTGVFTAPAATGSTQTITVTATSVQDGTKSGTATVTIAGASTVSGVNVSPTTATGNQTFTATVNGTNSPSQAVTWSLIGGGSINSSGVFTAPASTASPQTVTVTATSVQDGTKSGTATVTVPASTVTMVTVTPGTATGAQQFNASVLGLNGPSQVVTWTLSPTIAGASISSSGAYTPPTAISTSRTQTVTATSTQDATKSGTATITLPAESAPPTFTGTITQTALTSTSCSIDWSSTTHTDNIGITGYEQRINGGAYTAIGNVLSYAYTVLTPSTAYTFDVRAFDAAGNRSAPLSLTTTTSAATGSITSVSVSPNTSSGSQTFTASVVGTGGYSTAVNWSASAGSINGLGQFTAPAATTSQQTITVTATSAQDGTVSGTATVIIAAVLVPRATIATYTLTDANNNPLPNLTNLRISYFDQPSADLLLAPIAKTATGTTDAYGNGSIGITGTALNVGQIGSILVSNGDGTVTQSPAAKGTYYAVMVS
jgi:hypothetical protein